MDPFAAYEEQGLTWERAMAHARRLALRAGELAAGDPSWRPVAVILTPDSKEIRDQLPELLRNGMAQAGDWVPLLVSREQALAVLRSNAPATLDWLEPHADGKSRRLPVIVVTPFGYKLGHAPYEVAARPPSGRVPCTVLALLLCREAFQQAGSGKWCLIGIHDRVHAARLPTSHSFAVFVSLGDFTSGSKLAIVVRRDDDELCRAEAEAGVAGGIGNLDFGVQLPPLQLSSAGIYQIDLRAGGKVLATRQLIVEGPAS
jgi:hypothetical protein